MKNIKPKWTFTAGGDVTATPTIYNGRIYVPDWSGNMWCLDATTGATIWTRKIYDLVMAIPGLTPAPYPSATPVQIISRASPVISGSVMVSYNMLRLFTEGVDYSWKHVTLLLSATCMQHPKAETSPVLCPHSSHSLTLLSTCTCQHCTRRWCPS